MRALPKLTLSSARMVYRSPASLRVALMSPLMFSVVIALFHQLRFRTGSESVYSGKPSPGVSLATSPDSS